MKEDEVWDWLEDNCEDLDGEIVIRTEERKRKARIWKRVGEGVDERARDPPTSSFNHGDLYEAEGIDR